METCENCKFMENSPGFSQGSTKNLYRWEGYCCLMPPVPLLVDERIISNWPKINKDNWCGQFKLKE